MKAINTRSQLPTHMLRDLYAKMLLTRIVGTELARLNTHVQSYQAHSEPSRGEQGDCLYGYEAAQVGSAACIEVGTDFTLPSARDIGVVLTIGMTAYEIFRSCLQSHNTPSDAYSNEVDTSTAAIAPHYWGYHKHNTVTGSGPMALGLLHAAGIAFASKLRKAAVVTVAYCDQTVSDEADFQEALSFAAQHQLPVIFLCEHAYSDPTHRPPDGRRETLPGDMHYQCIDGTDIVAVVTTMQQAMQGVRSGHGPLFIEMILRPTPSEMTGASSLSHNDAYDPLNRCKRFLQMQGEWNAEWADELTHRLTSEVEDALHNALRDTYGCLPS